MCASKLHGLVTKTFVGFDVHNHLGPKFCTEILFYLLVSYFLTCYAELIVFFPSTIKVIFIKMRQNHNFETWKIEGECFQESIIIPLNSTWSHSHLRQR